MSRLLKTIFLPLLMLLCISNAYAITNVAGVAVLFSKINQAASNNCPSNIQTLLINNPVKVTLLISQNSELNYGFGDLLLNGETFANLSYLPQLVLTNEGLNKQLMLMGVPDANNPIQVLVKNTRLDLKEIITRNIDPLNGNMGTAIMLLSVPNTASHEVCALEGQVISSTRLP